MDTNLAEILDQFKSLTRETDSIDLEHKCLELCKQFIGGKWTGINVEDIIVEKLTSGLANQTYRCKTKQIDASKDVVIRVFGLFNRIDFNNRKISVNQIDESIVALMAAQNGIGPQVYGLFGKGLIMKYYSHRHFNEKDLFDHEMLRKLASKLAAFHAMRPSLNKTQNKVKNIIDFFANKTDEELAQKREIFRKYDFEILSNFDFKSETDWIFDKIKSFDSPLVFSHNDFRIANVLVLEDRQLVLSDFDCSGYFNRALDFASLFASFDKSAENLFEFNDEFVVKTFIRYYIEENEKLFGKQYSENKCNSVEHILMETKVFSMIYCLFCASLTIDAEFWEFPLTEKTCMVIANLMIKRYLLIKDTLIAENILTN